MGHLDRAFRDSVVSNSNGVNSNSTKKPICRHSSARSLYFFALNLTKI